MKKRVNPHANEWMPETGRIVTEPVYRQLLRVCRESIDSGRLQAGEQFPSERDLAARYEVSRTTANKVISHLVAEHLLELRPGLGAFVTGSKTLHASLREMESFTEQMKLLGHRPGTEVLVFVRMPLAEAPEPVAHVFAGGHGVRREVFFVERLRLADGEPVILELRWLCADRFKGLRKDDLGGSFYAILEERYQVHLSGEEHVIRGRNLDREEARKLGCRRGAAALEVEGTGFTDEDEVIWYQRLLYRGDRYELRNETRTHPRSSNTSVRLIPAH